MFGVAAHVALDLMLAGETKQIAGRLPKVLAAAHLALPASAVDSMEQVVGQADRDPSQHVSYRNHSTKHDGYPSDRTYGQNADV